MREMVTGLFAIRLWDTVEHTSFRSKDIQLCCFRNTLSFEELQAYLDQKLSSLAKAPTVELKIYHMKGSGNQAQIYQESKVLKAKTRHASHPQSFKKVPDVKLLPSSRFPAPIVDF